MEEDPDALSLTVLPGEYTFAAPKGGKYLTYGDDQKVTVTADEDTSSALSGSTVEFRQRLTEQAVTDAAAIAARLFRPFRLRTTDYRTPQHPAFGGGAAE